MILLFHLFLSAILPARVGAGARQDEPGPCSFCGGGQTRHQQGLDEEEGQQHRGQAGEEQEAPEILST